jgi:hypothetical protein
LICSFIITGSISAVKVTEGLIVLQVVENRELRRVSGPKAGGVTTTRERN